MFERVHNSYSINWPASFAENCCKIDQSEPVQKSERRNDIAGSALREEDVSAAGVWRKHDRVPHTRLFPRRHSTIAPARTTTLHRSIDLSSGSRPMRGINHWSGRQCDRGYRIHVLLLCQEDV